MEKKIPTEGGTMMANYEDDTSEGETSKDEKKNDDQVNDFAEFEGVKKQIEAEYQLAYRFIKPKWDKWALRLKLYNNQKRGKEDIGDPLLFTIFQTVLASLYSDQLTVEFVGREHGDDDTAENLQITASFDAEEMEKTQLDYEWIFDTLFFNRGLILMNEWDDVTHTPVPEVIDPLTFLRDPDATSVNGDRAGRGAARFFGREVRMTEREMEDSGLYSNIDQLGENDESQQTEIDRNKMARREAQGYDSYRAALCGDNASHVLYEWFTWYNNKRYIFTLGRDRKVLLRVQEIKTKRWPVVDRVIYPSSHDWDGVSIPDLVEDKQRGRATIMNLAKKGVTAKLYPNYLYNNNIIKNRNDLAKIEFNKFVGVAGNPNNVVAPIPREGITTDVQWMMDLMDGNAQKATATPDIQQGALTEKVKSATEIAKVSQGVDTRYSMTAKLFGWSEKKFWKLWYEKYNLHFKAGIHNKTVRLAGPLGPEYRKVTRENLIGNADPDIFIESKTISDAKRMNRLNMLASFMNQAVAMDSNANKRFMLKEQAKAMGLSSDEINRALPKTFDEMEAEAENQLLEQEKLPKVLATQNHVVHIQEHSKAVSNKYTIVHINAHKHAMLAIRNNPALGPQPVTDPATGATVAASPNGEQPSPMEQGKTPAPRDMAQSPLQLQAPNAIQQG